MDKTVLVVHTDQSAREFYTAELEAEEYRVLTASSGREALDLMQRARVDLVYFHLADNRDMALASLSEMTHFAKHLKVVLSTDYPNCYFDFRMWVADACLPKSEDLAFLKNTINGLLLKPNSTADKESRLF